MPSMLLENNFMVSANGIVPWHKIGVILDGVLTSEEAIRARSAKHQRQCVGSILGYCRLPLQRRTKAKDRPVRGQQNGALPRWRRGNESGPGHYIGDGSMKNIIIKDERTHRVISGNAISILDSLPALIYELAYDSDDGFRLNAADYPFKNSEKLFGKVDTITAKVLNTFDIVKGNLGVLFSGPKGLGKSLTVRNICKEDLLKGISVILINKHFENITSFIESICQPIVVVFDEFEKKYLDRNKAEKDDLEGQDSLLNLFDSTLEGKKLFLLTCNDLHNLSEYLLRAYP